MVGAQPRTNTTWRIDADDGWQVMGAMGAACGFARSIASHWQTYRGKNDRLKEKASSWKRGPSTAFHGL